MNAVVRGPTIGLPEGTKSQGQRVDFKEDKFTLAIETKGPRVAWARSSVCPCTSINDQTQQADPNCSLCNGSERFYFQPANYMNTIPDDAKTLTPLQERILTLYDAVVIRAVVVSVMRTIEDFDKLGEWILGTSLFSVRPENRLGHHDRLVMLDSVLPFSQYSDVLANGTVPTRWPVNAVNMLRSLNTVYTEGAEYEVTSTGNVQFLSGHAPSAGTRVSIHYDHHPHLLVWEHTHAFRDSLKAFKTATPTTPLGDPQALPLQVLARLEWLVND